MSSRYQDNLDIVAVDLVEHRATQHQSENWLVRFPMQFIRRATDAEVRRLLQPHLQARPELVHGTTDRISISSLGGCQLDRSLDLAQPTDLKLQVTTNIRDSRKVRAVFTWNGVRYSLAITDPLWLARCRHLAMGMHDRSAVGLGSGNDPVLTISLSEPFGGNCYKLVAAVILLG